VNGSAAVPCVSVVVPAFNRAHCLGAALRSVFAQTLTDFEVVVVDDGSTDNTVEVAKSFGDRVRVLSQKNSGAGAARNAGVAAARGKWIAFQDSDDEWCPQKLERQLAVLQKHGGVWCATLAVDADGKPLGHFARPRDREVEANVSFSSTEALRWVDGLAHPAIQSMLIEKTLVEKAGPFDEKLFAAEDTEFIFRVSLLAGLYFVDEPLLVISEATTDSLTRSVDPKKRERRFDGYLRAQEKIQARLKELGRPCAPAVRNNIGYYLSNRAELACLAGDFALARTLAGRGIGFGGLKNLLRCAAIWCAPSCWQKRFQKKWEGQWL
jgi:glycosyltransferase involved in cell wall biosynthesis